MTAPTGAYSEFLSATLRDIDKVAVDNISQKHPTFELVKSNAKSQPGGASMVLPVILGEETAPQFAADGSGFFVPTKSSDIITSAEYDFGKAQIGHVRLDYITLEKNTGKNQLIDLLATHRQALVYQFQKDMATRMHQTDASRAAGSYLSLDSLCNDAVHEVGGIDYTDAGNSGWKPVTQEYATGATIKQAIRSFVDAERVAANGNVFDRLVVGKNTWDLLREYLDEHSALTTVGSNGRTEIEWQSVTFEGVEIAWDYDCPDSRIYGLTRRALHWRWLNNNFMKVMDPMPVFGSVSGQVANSLDKVYPVVNVFAVGTNERRALGLVTDVPAA
jgi:hypothetical protein